MSSPTSQLYFGIDLGMTSACIAWVNDAGEPFAIPNAAGNARTPAVAGFEEAINDGVEMLVGEGALELGNTSPEAVCHLADCDFNDPSWRFRFAGREFSARAIVSAIIASLVETASASNLTVEKIVLSVPTTFVDGANDIFIQAAQDRGLYVLDVITAATAATIGYPIDEEPQNGNQDQSLLVYDLGGTHFEATLIAIENGEISTTGSAVSGGACEWDALIVEYLANEFVRMSCSDKAILETTQAGQLRSDAEKAKRHLTQSKAVEVSVSFDEFTETVTLTRETFDRLTLRPLFQTFSTTKLMLRDTAIAQQIDALVANGLSRVDAEDTVYSQIAPNQALPQFDKILFVGSGSLMPSVQQQTAREFGVPGIVHMPDVIVALGAALHAQEFITEPSGGSSLDETIQETEQPISDLPSDHSSGGHTRSADDAFELQDTDTANESVFEESILDENVLSENIVEGDGAEAYDVSKQNSRPIIPRPLIPQATDEAIRRAVELSNLVSTQCSIESDETLTKIWNDLNVDNEVPLDLQQRVSSARERLACLRQLPDAIRQADQGLKSEFDIATLADPLLREPQYEHDLKPRIELARELASEEPNEEYIAVVWEKLRRLKQQPKHAETDRRCLLAVHRAELFKRFRQIERLRDTRQQDSAWVDNWNDKLLKDCPAADGYRERVQLAKQRLNR